VLARCLGLCKPALSLTLQNWKGSDPVEITLKLPKIKKHDSNASQDLQDEDSEKG
jgi:hypothetical protein